MAKWARRGRRSRRAVSRYWYLGNEAQPVIGPQRVDPFEHDDPYEIRQALAALENGQLPTEEETAIVDG